MNDTKQHSENDCLPVRKTDKQEFRQAWARVWNNADLNMLKYDITDEELSAVGTNL